MRVRDKREWRMRVRYKREWRMRVKIRGSGECERVEWRMR